VRHVQKGKNAEQIGNQGGVALEKARKLSSEKVPANQLQGGNRPKYGKRRPKIRPAHRNLCHQ